MRSTNTLRDRKWRIWIAGVSLLAVFGGLLWISASRAPAAMAAERLAVAMERRDARALYAASLPEERVAGLTEDRLRTVLAGRPGQVIASLTPVTPRETTVSGLDSGSGVTVRYYRTSRGTRFAAGSMAELTEKGGSCRVLFSILTFAWRADLSDTGRPMESVQGTEAKLTGIRRDREFLTSVGLEGMWLGPQDGFLTWDELEARYERRLAPKGAPPVAAR